MDEPAREVKTLAYSRFIHAVAVAVVMLEVTGGPMSSDRFLRLAQKGLDISSPDFDAVLLVVHSDTAASEMIAELGQAVDAVRPLVLRAIDESSCP